MRKSLFIVLSFNLTSEIEKAAHFGSVLEAASKTRKATKNRKKTLNIFVALISGVNGGLRCCHLIQILILILYSFVSGF